MPVREEDRMAKNENEPKVVHIEKIQEGTRRLDHQVAELLTWGHFDKGSDKYRATLDNGNSGVGGTPESAARDAKRK